MEFQIFRDTLSAAGSFCCAKTEIPIETEILLSDYLPRVYKIVKCFVKMVVLQKQLQTGRLNLEGYLRCIVYYQGENGEGLCQGEQKIPFTRAMELPQMDYSTFSAVVGGETEFLNCRAVNSRRIEVRGAYEAAACISTQVLQEVISSVAECGAEQKQTEITGVSCIASMDKLFAAEADFRFDQPPAAILDLVGTTNIRELRVISGKAVIKGELTAEIAYRVESGGALRAQRVAVPFQQILDAEGLTEGCHCFAAAEAVGFTVTETGENEGSRLSASVILHLRAYSDQHLSLVTDLFSTQYETTCEQNTVCVEQIAKKLDEITTVSATGQLPDEHAKLLACLASFGVPELAGEAPPQLRAHGVVTVFCENSLNEIESYEKQVEFLLPLAELSGTETYRAECWLTVREPNCKVTAGTLQVDLAVQAEGLVMRRITGSAIAKPQLGAAYTPADPEVSLRVYYAQPGEDVFEIARRFHVSPQRMRRENQLECEVLSAPCRLLVPGAG